MKALSLIQPWATLWALGIKEHETRSFWTNFRGPLLIHASKTYDKKGEELWNHPSIKFDLSTLGKWKPFESLPRGAIVGKVDITDCVMMTNTLISTIDEIERLCGDWKEGRFYFKARGHKIYNVPIEVRGSLGLWDFPRIEEDEPKQKVKYIRRRKPKATITEEPLENMIKHGQTIIMPPRRIFEL